MTRDEKIMLGTMGFALALWVSPRYLATGGAGRHRVAAGCRLAAARPLNRFQPSCRPSCPPTASLSAIVQTQLLVQWSAISHQPSCGLSNDWHALHKCLQTL
jgi:hypothetical protein